MTIVELTLLRRSREMDTPPLVHTGWLFLMAGHRWSTIVLMGTLVTFKMSPMKELPAMLLPLLFMLHPLFMLPLLFTVLPLLFMLPLLFTVLPLLFMLLLLCTIPLLCTMPLLSTMPLLPMLLLTQSTQHVFLLPQLPIPSEVKWPQQFYVFIYDKYLFIGINDI